MPRPDYYYYYYYYYYHYHTLSNQPIVPDIPQAGLSHVSTEPLELVVQDFISLPYHQTNTVSSLTTEMALSRAHTTARATDSTQGRVERIPPPRPLIPHRLVTVEHSPSTVQPLILADLNFRV